MPKREDIKKILIIGSGPIVIGQACEFDYSGTQAVRVLRSMGYEVVLVNSNPATIMTDPDIADRTYIEPLEPMIVKKIIEKEKPCALLPTMGGQTALNIAIELDKLGVLKENKVELIGANIESINKAEDRELFDKTMKKAGLKTPVGDFAYNLEQAIEIVEKIGFPAIIRPSFTLGGSGGNIANNMEEYKTMARWGLEQSPNNEILVEKSLIGWKEYELEVMRDTKDNVVIICSIENLDPMGVHTGDSITVAPAQTLTDKQFQLLRDGSLKIMRAIGVDTGGSNVQFAVNPENGDFVVIEMNPRVSRSSALASKATGFPIAKIAAMLSVGMTLDEIPNDITKKTPASFEPTLDYVVVKIPRWDFAKFPMTEPILTTQMKSVGEAMAVGRTFKEAFQKAFRSLENSRHGYGADGKDPVDVHSLSQKEKDKLKEEIKVRLEKRYWDNIFYLRIAMHCGMSIDELFEITKVDRWFLYNISQLIETENKIFEYRNKIDKMPDEILREAKQRGFSDFQIAYLTNTVERKVRSLRKEHKILPVYKMIDTCAGEFESSTSYFYSSYDEENEVQVNKKRKVIVLGSGPNRIGQGIEFDYCCVHCIMALKQKGIEAIMINSNPETVSTDYDISDKLYFEPLSFEDVMNIIEMEKPEGVIIQFGGQTPLKLSTRLHAEGVKILGTSPSQIDLAENRELFGGFLRKMKVDHPEYGTAVSTDEAKEIAAKIGFPVLVRPSYVLGGRAMEIVYDEESLVEYMKKAIDISPDHPVLIDRFLEDAFEFDVDAICDGEDVLIGGVMQHIEEAGVHSGDSSAVLPAFMISPKHEILIREITRDIALKLKVCGLINIQFALKDDKLYILEVNPRASRTIPFVSKAIGLALPKLATFISIGEKLKDYNYKEEIIPPYISVKEAVLPFNKFPGTPLFLSPEMRSTGEVMGISKNFGNAFAKVQMSIHTSLPQSGGVLLSVNDKDKRMIVPIARNFAHLGFKLYATKNTAKALKIQGLDVKTVHKITESQPNIIDFMREGEIHLVVNTPLGKESREGEILIGRNAIKYNIPMITTLSGALAAISGIESLQNESLEVYCLQDYHKEHY